MNIEPAQRISFSIGFYDPAIWTLGSFVDRIIAFGVRNLTFWNLVEMEHQTLVKPLRNLDAANQMRARAILASVCRTLEDADIDYILRAISTRWWPG